MASTYSTSLRLELMATGDQSGTWGDTTNTNLGTLLEQAITGVLSVAQGDVANLTLTNLNGASDQARNAVINLTGAMTANRNVVVPAANKLYFVKNSTTGGFVITVKTSGGTGVTIPPSTGRWVYCDGTNVVDMYSGNFTPSANDATALGASGVAWADLFLASGGVINWNTGDVTITHSANALAFAGASSGYNFDAQLTVSSGNLAVSAGAITVDSTAAGTLLTLTSTDAGATSGPNAEMYRNSASPAANDVLSVLYWYGKDSAANKQEYASTQVTIVDPTSTSEDAMSEDYVTVGGTRTAFLRRAALASGTADPNAVGLPKGQLSFPGTQNPSTDPNTLDDYEEGTFTPVLAFGGASVGITYLVQQARYVKIGSLVNVSLYIALTNKGSSTGAATISTLPFTAKTVAAYFWSGAIGYNNITSNGGGIIASSGTAIQLYIGTTQMANTDFANNSEIMFNISYEAAN